MGTNKEQGIVNTYFQDVTIKNACELLAIEQRLKLDGLVLPNNVIVNRNGVSCAEFIQWYENPQYPKTYEGCCEVLGIGSYFEPEIRNATTEECHKFTKLMRLKRCRDAYWKIAGEQMGLNDPWKPDWKDKEQIKFVIIVQKENIQRYEYIFEHKILAFPTEEMRDAFYKNFKKLIEQCKELL